MKITTHSVDETWKAAAELADMLHPGSVLALQGELGSGKTCFVQGLAIALEIMQPVTSPTFKLVNEYEGRLPLYHLDLYRLGSEEESLFMGIEDYLFGKGITAIEWADRIPGLLPPSTIHINFKVLDDPDSREIIIDDIANKN